MFCFHWVANMLIVRSCLPFSVSRDTLVKQTVNGDMKWHHRPFTKLCGARRWIALTTRMFVCVHWPYFMLSCSRSMGLDPCMICRAVEWDLHTKQHILAGRVAIAWCSPKNNHACSRWLLYSTTGMHFLFLTTLAKNIYVVWYIQWNKEKGVFVLAHT